MDLGADAASNSSSDIEDETLTPFTPLTPSSSAGTTDKRLKNYLCPYEDCDKAFTRPVRLEEHIRSHTNTRPFQCPHTPCDKNFLRQSHLTHHIKSAHTAAREHVCNWPECGKGFTSGTRLRRHRDVHEGANKYRCTEYPGCDKVFRKHSTLQRHIDADHLSQKAFHCTQIDDSTGQSCIEAFDTALKLKSHVRKVHLPPSHVCTLCATIHQVLDTIAFNTHAELQAHIKEAHPPQCDFCGTTCATNKELQRHIEFEHTQLANSQPRDYVCSVPDCGRAFTRAGNLTVHVKCVHDQHRPWICGETDMSESLGIETWSGDNACGWNFGAKASLEKHIRKQHLGLDTTEHKEKIRQSNHGPKEISILSQLTGEGYAQESGRKIMCTRPGCPNHFYRLYDLQVHLDAFHGLEDFEIAEALAEQEALTGGRFWLGGTDDEEDVIEAGLSDTGKNASQAVDPFNFIAEGGLSNDVEAIDPALAWVDRDLSG